VPPAAGKTTAAAREPTATRRRVRRLAGTLPARLRRHRGGDYPDRYFLDNVAGWILELDRGEGIPWEGNYSSWLEQKDQRWRRKLLARRKSIEKELEWVRQGAKGRQSKGKARLARFEELNNVEYQKRNETNELFIPPGPRLGDKVLEVSHLRKSYGDRVLIDDLSFSVPKGAIVGIIGPNGAGKSTLFRMMSGQEQPDSGTITLGETVKLASVDQFRDAMDNSKSPAAWIS
jgi:ATPase subunit of ABC transporter with duplicated ATPase domains